MNSVLLIYPYFRPLKDWSIFRFPPLGLGYIAGSLRKAGYDVDILDCTFMDKKESMEKAARRGAGVIGIYCMVGLRENALEFARHLQGSCNLLVAGGPLPTIDPSSFLDDFAIVVLGEGERTLLEIMAAYEKGTDFQTIRGIAYRKEGKIVRTPPRPLIPDLDGIPFPVRDCNSKYIEFSRRKYGRATTAVMTTRGCPFACDFCSNAVFGNSYRERSAANVIDEVEEVLSLGYVRIHFADDVFTLNSDRVMKICEEIRMRHLHFSWECLGRVGSVNAGLAGEMKLAGCERIFFGIESGSDTVLKLMNKKITVHRAREAVLSAHNAGLRTGAFFMLGYPGETDETVLTTIRFATSLPLDYVSFTVPYPLPGTNLYERIGGRITRDGVGRPGLLTDHSLIFKTDFSEMKLKYALLKGETQFLIHKKFGKFAPLATKPFVILSDAIFKLLK